jgi:hypothetical protein
MFEIKKFFLDAEINKAAKKNRSRCSVKYNDAKKIGILYSVTDLAKHELVKSFIKELEAAGKAVEVYTFLDKGKENFEFRYEFFEAADFGIFGKLASESLSKFIEKPFDFLFLIDLIPNIYMNYILARSKAKCRVGKYFPEQANYFELMINLAENQNQEQGLIAQIKHYTKEI